MGVQEKCFYRRLQPVGSSRNRRVIAAGLYGREAYQDTMQKEAPMHIIIKYKHEDQNSAALRIKQLVA